MHNYLAFSHTLTWSASIFITRSRVLPTWEGISDWQPEIGDFYLQHVMHGVGVMDGSDFFVLKKSFCMFVWFLFGNIILQYVVNEFYIYYYAGWISNSNSLCSCFVNKFFSHFQINLLFSINKDEHYFLICCKCQIFRSKMLTSLWFSWFFTVFHSFISEKSAQVLSYAGILDRPSAQVLSYAGILDRPSHQTSAA